MYQDIMNWLLEERSWSREQVLECMESEFYLINLSFFHEIMCGNWAALCITEEVKGRSTGNPERENYSSNL